MEIYLNKKKTKRHKEIMLYAVNAERVYKTCLTIRGEISILATNTTELASSRPKRATRLTKKNIHIPQCNGVFY